MPGFILHSGAVVICVHAGMAQPMVVDPRVTVSGQPIVTLSSTYSIAGCTFPVMTASAPPCVTAQFVTSAARVTATGQPVLLQDSQAVCTPNGTPLLISVVQPRVSAM